jgi:hypothetical protein
MTATNQNFTMFAGDTKNIIVTIDNATDLLGATFKWGVRKKEYSTTNDLLKESPEIVTDKNTITIKLKPPDTANLLGSYYHECEVTDQQKNVSTVFTGLMTIKISGV